MNPPVPGAKFSVYWSTPASTASAVVSITRSSETPFAASSGRIDLYVPLLEALAVDVHRGHPGTRSRRCLIFQ